ncbi:dihydrolipoamide acetyltransferase [Striga asiatica]|uniref:Dihydrolipoamide acetyltransferase n=1 Tax=Striga asiatica TaxID=4170 RepID=A0A5A7PY05_STRAF|nr:dihydrolipoamide acetyltransferase [Striga asiatica]
MVCVIQKGDEKRKMAHEILNVWSTNNIFPPNYSFRKVCFCDECSTMIDELNDFAESTRSLLESVMDITSFVSQLIIRDTSQHAHSTVFEFCSKERLRDKQIEIQKVIAESGIIPNFEVNRADEKDLSCVAECIRFDIVSREKFYYKPFRVQNVAHALLDQILEIEDEHEVLKADRGIEVDPSNSNSKGHLERKIKYLEQLPVEELFSEVEDIIRTICDIITFMTELPFITMLCIFEVEWGLIDVGVLASLSINRLLESQGNKNIREQMQHKNPRKAGKEMQQKKYATKGCKG